MEIIKHYKLVRDKTPEIIGASGKSCITESLSDEDYIIMLDEKLNEECNEYQESKSLEELADMMEVIYAITKARGYSIEQLKETQAQEAAKRGGFEKKILLKVVVEE